MRNNITYYRKGNHIECIYYQNTAQHYPTHTHANHIMLGSILDGKICITCNGEEHIYQTNEHFGIMPDIPHAVEPVNDAAYSMISVCIFADQVLDESKPEITHLKKLKQLILDVPENIFLIEDMAQRIGISPYHMIRQFKAVCGLTPHQFQIQCRVRKAQKLLEKGESVVETAYATGFCDQSHFDRHFHKIVRLTPSEYKQSVKQLA